MHHQLKLLHPQPSVCLRSFTSHITSQPSVTVPPLLLKLRSDMKTAMKAKDVNRLNVLRALLAETTNASKTTSPYRTDVQLLALLRKRAAASKAAAQEFGAANRNDLKVKEEAQIAILEEYASSVKTLGEEEITSIVEKIIGKMRAEDQKIDMGTVLKALIGPLGVLEGRPLEKGEVAKIVKASL